MTVPVSNDTGTPPMKHLATNVKTELISHLQNCTFVLHMDWSTGVTELAVSFVWDDYLVLILTEEFFGMWMPDNKH